MKKYVVSVNISKVFQKKLYLYAIFEEVWITLGSLCSDQAQIILRIDYDNAKNKSINRSDFSCLPLLMRDNAQKKEKMKRKIVQIDLTYVTIVLQ